MAGQVGRISGGVLQDNLLRNGFDLNFKNLSSSTALLHLDVNNNRIGVNTEVPLADLHVETVIGTNGLYANNINVNQITIENSSITSNSGNLELSSGSNIQLSTFRSNNIQINDNTISTFTANSNLEVRPDGTGTVEILADTNITGSLHSTGNITVNGNLTIGNNDADDLIFDAEVKSDIIPNLDSTYNLGNSSKRYKSIHTDLVNGERVVVDSISVSDTSLALRQGNIFYVSTLGDDSNVGDHQHGAFRTIRHALSVVDASSGGPVTIHVFPGTYEETFPLVIPERVTISGQDIRNTIVVPDTASEAEDVFHLNQNCTIENITIKDFYYDNLNDTGYAFSFAPGALITERSPYIRNVTVITQGSITSVNDPRGFDAGDAGKGALIDGAVVDNLTPTPSMLFHSVTFITPGVDCITMTNGVRVEWLNSFTYFANRGLYATNGSGRIGPDGSTLEYGAEIRSIGSANVYGNYGAVADGADTLMYLIGHNLAYIGVGKNVSNDNTLILQDQEITELNNGKIYYVSTDAGGTFRVGDAFYVDFDTGTTSIDATGIDFSGISSLFINTGGNITYIDGERIDLGDFRISGNTIETLTEDFIFNPTTGIFNVFTNNDAFVLPNGATFERTDNQGDLRYNTDTDLFEGFSTANVGFGGIYSDDRKTNVKSASDVLSFTVDEIEVGTISNSSGGKISFHGLETNNISFQDNEITSLSNSDINFQTAGVGSAVFYDLEIFDNVINNLSNNNLVLDNITDGAVKFDGTGGVVIPSGSPVLRPTSPEAGMLRFNTDESILESYDGIQWVDATGAGGDVTEADMEDILNLYILVLG